MYGVLVEYFEDEIGGVVAVDGPYDTYEDAVSARDRLGDASDANEPGSYETVRQVVQINRAPVLVGN